MTLDVELLGRIAQRVERVEHARLRLAVERQRAPQLDQRARNRLDERPLRQTQVGRCACAFVAGFVARRKRHDGLGAGPRMLGEVLGGLPDPVLGARLRQRQRDIRRVEQVARRLAVGAFGAVLQLELSLRADHAVVVLKLVGELKGAALLRLRVLGERDRRRTVRDGGEAPDDVVRHRAAQRHGAGFVDDETTLVGTAFVGALVLSDLGGARRARGLVGRFLARLLRIPGFHGLGVFDAAGHGDVKTDLSAGANDERAARRHCDGSPPLAAPARPAASRPARPAACRCRSADSPRRRCGSSRAPSRPAN